MLTQIKLLARMGPVLVALLFVGGPARAAQVEIEAVLATKEQIRLKFEEDSGHFLLLVLRKGNARGSAPFHGATVSEYGVHDVVPGEAGKAHGYLEFTTPNGDKAYIAWRADVVFMPRPDGKTALTVFGSWKLTAGTGTFAGMKGVGSLRIEPADRHKRRFILSGTVTNDS